MQRGPRLTRALKLSRLFACALAPEGRQRDRDHLLNGDVMRLCGGAAVLELGVRVDDLVSEHPELDPQRTILRLDLLEQSIHAEALDGVHAHPERRGLAIEDMQERVPLRLVESASIPLPFVFRVETVEMSS